MRTTRDAGACSATAADGKCGSHQSQRVCYVNTNRPRSAGLPPPPRPPPLPWVVPTRGGESELVGRGVFQWGGMVELGTTPGIAGGRPGCAHKTLPRPTPPPPGSTYAGWGRDDAGVAREKYHSHHRV